MCFHTPVHKLSTPVAVPVASPLYYDVRAMVASIGFARHAYFTDGDAGYCLDAIQFSPSGGIIKNGSGNACIGCVDRDQ